jgi:hypothetical protein
MIGIQKLHREPLSDELQALLFVLRIDREAPDRDRIRGKLSSIDWNQFLELVRHHRVVPWVHTRLQPFPELIPADIRKELHADYRANAFGMLQLAGEMERVGANLDRAGVPCLMLKGPILAETLYGDLSLRTSRDLDLLVPVDAVERAAEQLARMGYEANDSVHRILNDWKWKLHHLSFRHPVKKVLVELHWRFMPASDKEPTFDELWRRKRKSGMFRQPIYYLGAHDLFMHLTLHGMKHGWFRLRWLQDLDLMLRRHPPTDETIRHLRKYRCLAAAGQAVILLERLLGTPLNPESHRLSASRHARVLAEKALVFIRTKEEWAVRLPPRQARRFKRYLFSTKTFVQKGKYVLGKLYPSSWDAAALPLPKPLRFLYFPLRPFIWFWRQMRQEAGAGS